MTDRCNINDHSNQFSERDVIHQNTKEEQLANAMLNATDRNCAFINSNYSCQSVNFFNTHVNFLMH